MAEKANSQEACRGCSWRDGAGLGSSCPGELEGASDGDDVPARPLQTLSQACRATRRPVLWVHSSTGGCFCSPHLLPAPAPLVWRSSFVEQKTGVNRAVHSQGQGGVDRSVESCHLWPWPRGYLALTMSERRGKATDRAQHGETERHDETERHLDLGGRSTPESILPV